MRYTKEQISVALLLLKATGSPNKVVETLGYPSSPMLYHWRDKYPDLFETTPKQRHWKQAPAELKQSVIKRCINDGESVKSISEDIGYSESLIYRWLKEYRRKGLISTMKKKTNTTPSEGSSADDLAALNARMLDMQMEIDILKETINVLKKDPGVDRAALKNREKAVMIDALKNKYSLPQLCAKLDIPKSSYYYQELALKAEDKYKDLRIHIAALFHENRDSFGYRKIYTLLQKEGSIVSEKVIRRIM